MSPAASAETTKDLGYQSFGIGEFRFTRDEYFAHIYYPGGRHIMPIDAFLRAIMRDVAWGFFYGTVNFDAVLGTVNHYGTVDLFIGLFNEAYRSGNRHYVHRFDAKDLKSTFEQILDDWTNEGFDPFAAPDETGKPFGPKHGSNRKAIKRERVVAKRDRYEQAVRRIVASGIRAGAFVPCNAALVTRALLGALNWTARWYRPEGPDAPGTVAATYAEYLVRGLRT